MIILLLGLVGSGKSTIGQLLAAKTGARFVEMDTLILDTLGVKSPGDVSRIAWEECQLEISKDLSVQDNLVIAASGNIVENSLNILYFKTHAPNVLIVYLETSTDTLTHRTVQNHGGDSQAVNAHLSDLLADRSVLYKRFADTVVSTDAKLPVDIADAILASSL